MYWNLSKSLAVLSLTVLVGCQVPASRSGLPVNHNLPPAQMLMEPGPGIGGPGPGVLSMRVPPTTPAIGVSHPSAGGQMAGMSPGMGPGMGVPSSVQVLFDRPEGMQINWDVSGVGRFDSAPLMVPNRQNFGQGGIYQLRLSNIQGRPALQLYPTLEVAPMNSRTASYLAHSAIPIQFTDADFDQVMAGNFVTKVIYVPDPEFQELALAGVDTLVSTRLDPGIDPVAEADRRGSVLAIIRMGNKDLEIPGSMGGQQAALSFSQGYAGQGMHSSPNNYISGVNGPHYGMPSVGTSIGLPGPPHLPMGGPAGLQRYTINNHTAQAIPGPTPRVDVHVKQQPGLSYPRPVNKILVRERTIRPPHVNAQPPSDMVHGDIRSCDSCGGAGCNNCR